VLTQALLLSVASYAVPPEVRVPTELRGTAARLYAVEVPGARPPGESECLTTPNAPSDPTGSGHLAVIDKTGGYEPTKYAANAWSDYEPTLAVNMMDSRDRRFHMPGNELWVKVARRGGPIVQIKGGTAVFVLQSRTSIFRVLVLEGPYRNRFMWVQGGGVSPGHR
jgi:hypothetical protein